MSYTNNGIEEPMDERVDNVTIQNSSVGELKGILKHVLTTDIVPYIWGPPGIGKSESIRQLCIEDGYDLVDLRLSLLNPVDLMGIPVIGKDEKTVKWSHPEFLPHPDSKRKGILFLDEINLAPDSTLKAAYQLILDKRVGSYIFPKSWRIIAAGNRTEDRASVYRLPAPLANRFIHFTVQPNFLEWKKWATGNIIDEVMSFLETRPNVLFQAPREGDKAFCTPRSWHFLSRLLEKQDLENITNELKQLIVSAIGEGMGKEFIVFISKSEGKKLRDLVDTFMKTGEFRMPQQISIRHAFINSVFVKNVEGRVNPKYYKNFHSKLKPEEKQALKEVQKSESEKIEKRRATYDKKFPEF